MSGPRHAERPEHRLNPDELEVAPGFQHETLQGWVPPLASDPELGDALEKAFDYRGDVTITHKDGTKLDGYIFDRSRGKTLESSYVRVLPRSEEHTSELQSRPHLV